MNKLAISQVKMSIVIIIIVVAVAAGAYLGIRPSSPQVATSMTSGAVSVPNPDTLVVETLGQPDSVDPATAYTVRDTPITQNVFEELLGFVGDNASQVVPWLAQ